MYRWSLFKKAQSNASSIRRQDLAHRSKQWRQKVTATGGKSSRSLWQSLRDGKQELPGVIKNGVLLTSESDTLNAVYDHFQALATDKDSVRMSAEVAVDDTRQAAQVEPGGPYVQEGPKVQFPPPDDTPHSEPRPVNDNTPTDSITLDSPFLLEEVRRMMTLLPNATAPGEDGVPNEFLKYGGDLLTTCIWRFFLACQRYQWTPNDWNSEIMKLLHKKGPRMNLDNYRGISLTNTIGKLFARLMNLRLLQEAESRGWLPETQAGFRWGRSTADNLFVLASLLDDAKFRSKEIHMAFIDVRKAYDTVDRAKLWAVLKTLGVSDAFISLLKSLYRDNIRRIKWRGKLTPPFLATKGLRQGCPLSPVLFALFVAHIPADLDSRCNGIKVGNTKITNLFYADDIVLLERGRTGMSRSILRLTQSLKGCGLRLNFAKSLIVHVTPRGVISYSWSMFTDDGKIEGTINEGPTYKYLGILLGHRGLLDHLQAKSKSIAFHMARTKSLARDSLDRVRTAEAFWTASVQPSLLHGAEALQIGCEWLQQLGVQQMKLARWIMGLHTSCSSTAARGIIGWLPPAVEVEIRQLQYWLKIQAMDRSRLPRLILDDIVAGDFTSGWYGSIRQLKHKYQVDESWIHLPCWQKQVRQHIIKVFWKEWLETATLKVYRFFDPQRAPYRRDFMQVASRPNLLQLLLVDKLSLWGNLASVTRCTLCKAMPADWVHHLLLDCSNPALQVPRKALGLPQDRQEVDGWLREILHDGHPDDVTILNAYLSTWHAERRLN